MADLARVTDLRTYPVISMDGTALTSAEVTGSGLAGDRAWSVVDADGAVVGARREPRLGSVRVTVGPDGPVLDLPDGASGVAGPEADAALSAYVGSAVRLAPAAGSRPGAAAVHLVSRQAIADSIGTTSDDPACDIESPRANITVDLGEDRPPGLERAWVGHEVVIGPVVLRVDRVPKNCLGVYAEVVTPGRINLGDSIRLRG